MRGCFLAARGVAGSDKVPMDCSVVPSRCNADARVSGPVADVLSGSAGTMPSQHVQIYLATLRLDEFCARLGPIEGLEQIQVTLNVMINASFQNVSEIAENR